MNKLIATLIAGFISFGAFAATTSVTPAGSTPTAAKAVAEPTKEVKKSADKAVHKSKEKAVTPAAKTPASVK